MPATAAQNRPLAAIYVCLATLVFSAPAYLIVAGPDARHAAAQPSLDTSPSLGAAQTAETTWDEEFVGPFASWVNLKTTYGATGDGVADDTAPLQAALNDVGTDGHPPVLFVPSGTYRITSTVQLKSRLHISIVGEDPSTTTLRWAGPENGVLMWISGMGYSKVDRLTFDGAGTASVLVDQSWDCTGPIFDTANEYADDRFRDAAIGIRGGNNDCGFAETSVWRGRFTNLTTAGIALKNFNALDLWVWYTLFDGCGVGVTNDPGAGNFHVYNSLFRNSKTSDMFIKNTGGFAIRNNTSIGSKAFWTTVTNFHHPAYVTLQGNLISTTAPTPILIGNQGPAVIIDNRINSAERAAPIAVGYEQAGRDGDALVVGNQFASTAQFVVHGRALAFDNVAGSPVQVSEPALPPTPTHRQRQVFDVPVGAKAATIQKAIDAAANAGQRAVVHLPAGEYAIDTPLLVSAHTDIQIVGDGQLSVLRWAGEGSGPVLRIQGPTRAILRDLHVNGSQRVEGVAIDHADQPGSRLFLNQAQLSGSRIANLMADGLDHLVIDARDIGHGTGPGGSVTVVGSARAAAGARGTATVNIFSGSGCCDTGSTYRLSNGGSLLVRDFWYEFRTADQPFATASGASELTIAGLRVARPASTPAFDFSDFRGTATLLTSMVDAAVRVRGNASGSSLFGDGLVMRSGLSNYLENTSSPRGAVGVSAMRMMRGSSSAPLPDAGSVAPDWVRRMLAQTRRAQPQVIGRLPDGVTDVRLYRVASLNAVVGVLVKP